MSAKRGDSWQRRYMNAHTKGAGQRHQASDCHGLADDRVLYAIAERKSWPGTHPSIDVHVLHSTRWLGGAHSTARRNPEFRAPPAPKPAITREARKPFKLGGVASDTAVAMTVSARPAKSGWRRPQLSPRRPPRTRPHVLPNMKSDEASALVICCSSDDRAAQTVPYNLGRRKRGRKMAVASTK